MSGVGDDLKALNEKLERVMNRLDYMEAILTESRKYPELARLMGDLKVGAALYGEPLKLIQRLHEHLAAHPGGGEGEGLRIKSDCAEACLGAPRGRSH